MSTNPVMSRFMALEEAALGQKNQEIEYVYYAKPDIAWVEKNAVSAENQEQWEISVPKMPGNAQGGRLRVRKTSWPGVRRSAEFVLTIKTKLPGSGFLEVEAASTLDAFEQFKTMSERGMIKRRYRVPCEGRSGHWEVDLFYNEDGTFKEWCKIDYEIKDGDVDECPTLPREGFTSIVRSDLLPKNQELLAQHHAFIRKLYDDVFVTKNQLNT